MNENIDLIKILKDCPKDWKFWSPILGEVEFNCNYENNKSIYINVNKYGIDWYFNSDAKIILGGIESQEIMIYPSREQRDWSKFTAPWYKKERFDPNTLKPFDKVLVRISNNDYKWSCDLFSYINNDTCRYHGVGYCAKYCIPYNDETKHLLGTTAEAPEYYRYWED